MREGKGKLEIDLLGGVSAASTVCFVAILCFVAAGNPTTRPLLTVVIAGLAAGGLILFRQLQKSAHALRTSLARAQYVATHDQLTQLPNKALFLDRLAIVAAEVGKGRDSAAIGVLCVGMDRFDEVSEVLGLSAGDAVIIEVTARLNAMARADDTVARLSDDVFGLLWSCADQAAAEAFADEIVQRLSAPYRAPAGDIVLTCSIGISLLTSDVTPPVERLRHAQLALSSARKLGGARHSVFNPSMDEALRERKSLEAELRRAIADRSLAMVYQPQVNAKGALVGVEALMRWNHEKRGDVSPLAFVALAESCGLGDAVGQFALRQAFLDSKSWPGLKVAINVSAPQIRSGDLVATLKELLAETRCDPSAFELEITEGVLLADEQETYDTLNAVRRLGFSIALDDFGTGYSSLSYLRRFPVDKIKIDRSFITQLGKRPESSAIVKAIIELAEALELKVLAEGVETKLQVDRLGELGCALFQGYFFSHPIANHRVTEMLAGRATLAAA
jgi:diguanylate cyclase (GGDEF)-like protein